MIRSHSFDDFPVLKESDIQRTCEDFLAHDQWRIFRLEQNFSERKIKLLGESGAPDAMLVRYGNAPAAEVLFIEWKRIRRGRRAATKPSTAQLLWHRDERTRGALTWIAGIDFPADIEGFLRFYKSSGLQRKIYDR